MNQGGVAIVTGALGLVGEAAVRRFDELGLDVIGIDNDARGGFFGDEGSTGLRRAAIERDIARYRHHALDIRDNSAIEDLFAALGSNIAVVLHAAAQPSHDWAAGAPLVDFAINASATVSVLDAARLHAPEARILLMSSNKVYGDTPNHLPLVQNGDRLELPKEHPFAPFGIDETMSIDQSKHSVFGVSKVAADLMGQEFAARFEMPIQVFRAGCLTGHRQRAVEAHGFLAYLCARVVSGEPYTIFGHGGRQVRDNLHADDLAEAFAQCLQGPARSGVYNIGGGRAASVSVLEALKFAGEAAGNQPIWQLEDRGRFGDHRWWISDFRRFQRDYPEWRPSRNTRDLIIELVDHLRERRT